VREHLAEKGLAGGNELLSLVHGSSIEYEALLERLLTQETSFFRYPAVYEALEKKILPEVQERKFWQNPGAAHLERGLLDRRGAVLDRHHGVRSAEIRGGLGDRDSGHGHQPARTAPCRTRRVLQAQPAEVSLGQVENYFTATKHGYQVKPRIRRMISFVQMNLVESVYVGKIDCIFCMNVLMYFSEERRLAILRRFYDALEPGGYFLLGHAETLTNAPVKFEPVVFGDCRIYRKPGAVEYRRAPALVEGAL